MSQQASQSQIAKEIEIKRISHFFFTGTTRASSLSLALAFTNAQVPGPVLEMLSMCALR